ncbi:hypothetical protein M885DRAFT_615228 [Pelagophyceae sp. CCMP2097]|nr:hypothetical protein M885DRAFT_615228 [Pelagophyceae sp. CCMP2097]
MMSVARLWAAAMIVAVASAEQYSSEGRRACEEEERAWMSRIVGNNKAILGAFPHKRCGGLFVECGANNSANSITNDLERNVGWKGLCVEAAPSHFKMLQKNRPQCENHNVALWHERATMVFREYDGGLKDHSGFDAMRPPESWASLEAAHPRARRTDHEVAARPLVDLLGGRTTIDFFSLDVEGAELAILRAFPFDVVTVEVWFIESNKLDRNALVDFMHGKSYACHHVDGVNTLCKHRNAAGRALQGIRRAVKAHWTE